MLLLDDGDATAGSPLASVWHREPRGRARARHAGDERARLRRHGARQPRVRLRARRARAHARRRARSRSSPPTWCAPTARPRFPPRSCKDADERRARRRHRAVHARGAAARGSDAVRGLPRSCSPIEIAQREVDRLRGAETLRRGDRARAHRAREGPAHGRAAPRRRAGRGLRLAARERGDAALDVVILGHTHVVVPSVEVGGALVTQAGKHGGGARPRRPDAHARERPSAPWKLSDRAARA